MSLRLSAQDAQKSVVRVRLSRRKVDGIHDSQGENITVSIGQSEAYYPSDPVCTRIPQLEQQTESTLMADYECDQGQHSGEYVKFSSDQDYLTICEARVFVSL